MKTLAARRGSKAADFYVETLIRDHTAEYWHLFAIENDAVHISVNVPVRFAHTFRDAALGRLVTPNELVFTAVSHVLESANEEGSCA